MDYQHKSLAEGRWEELSFSRQMGNIGSEVSRAVRWKKKGNNKQMENALIRCLELIDITVACRQKQILKEKKHNDGALRELLRSREVICDYFWGNNEYSCDEKKLIEYFDRFARADHKDKLQGNELKDIEE